MGAFDDLIPQRPGQKRLPTQEQFDIVAQQAGPFDNFTAGMGAGMRSYYLGGKQALGQASPDELEEYFRTVDSLEKTKAGTAGRMLGQALPAAASAIVPYANTVLGAFGVGTGLSALQPVREGESRAQNAIEGGMWSAAFPAAAALGRLGQAAISPFTKSGQSRIAGDVLNRFAGDPVDAARAAQTPRTLIPGSTPTLAEATGDTGLATLQGTLHSMDPRLKSALVAREAEQNAARIAALRGIAGTPQDLAQAIAEREKIATQLYKQAMDQGIDPARVTPQVAQKIDDLLKRPSMKTAVERAKTLAQDAGEQINDPTGSLRGMHYVKLALDDMLDASKDTSVGKVTKRNLAALKTDLVSVLDDLSPAYKKARETYQKMSQPVNQMEVTGRLYDKSTRALMEGTGSQRLYGDRFAGLIRDEEGLTRAATGMRQGLDDVLSPSQMRTLENIRQDLARTAEVSGKTAAKGSPTSQYLVGQDIVRRAASPLGVPSNVAEMALTQNFLSRPLSFAYKVPEERVLNLLGDALLDPPMAASLMGRASAPPPAWMRALDSRPVWGGLLGAGFVAGNSP